MPDVEDLRERLVGQRFYDREQDEAFTVVGVTSRPPLALLQYHDGVSWDEAASNFTVSEDVAQQFRLDEHGLDSERYHPLGAGPRIDQICDPDEHDWHPWPDDIWPSGVPDEVRERVNGHPRTFYDQIVRCKRCGLSGSVAGAFGEYGANGLHQPPWFCFECGEAVAGHEIRYHRDAAHCPECVPEVDESAGE